MIVPDLQQICEIMLFSEGFDTAKVLAKKMTVLTSSPRSSSVSSTTMTSACAPSSQCWSWPDP